MTVWVLSPIKTCTTSSPGTRAITNNITRTVIFSRPAQLNHVAPVVALGKFSLEEPEFATIFSCIKAQYQGKPARSVGIMPKVDGCDQSDFYSEGIVKK